MYREKNEENHRAYGLPDILVRAVDVIYTNVKANVLSPGVKTTLC